MSIRVLLLGSGGREHALAWKFSQSPLLDHIYVCPGNAGTSQEAKTTNIDHVSPTDFPKLVEFAVQHEINLVVPGPEQPLVDGVETFFRKVGIPVFGPSALAARMEGSKAFSKDFMARHNIPTARYKTFKSSQFAEATAYITSCGHPIVLKASGLAGGKGVLIPTSTDEAIQGLKEIMVSNVFGSAGDEVVIEEFLEGPEISVLAISDGYSIVTLPAAQDHKRIGEGDTGLNTGGMGAYAPAPVATPEILARIEKESLRPTIDGMRREGFPFVGCLFTGFILTSSGPKVLEYNVRFGDPETEALMLLLGKDVDLVSLFLACAEHRLDSIPISFQEGVAVTVILASKGYPGSYPKGHKVTFGNLPLNVVVFHAGTKKSGDDIVTAGGRVLAVTAYASSLQAALDAAYKGVDAVNFEGKTFRRDIAHRALSSTTNTQSLTYAQSGVSVDAGNSLVEALKPLVRSTRRPGTDAHLGGFGALFDLSTLTSPTSTSTSTSTTSTPPYTDPILVSGTDGVGTKLRLAIDTGVHDFVGIDLVAMSVNDLLVQGAEPLFFLDYFACARLEVDVARRVIGGVVEGCKQAGCALVGGETAEMPGMYHEGDYDLAGFAVGVVERSKILPSPTIKVGDVLLGLSSSGVHSNGFSLVRKIIAHAGLTFASSCPWSSDSTLGRTLLEPTRIYISQVLPLAQQGLIKGMSHITGGGFIENVPRVLPKDLGCYIDAAAWTLPPVFRWLLKEGNVAPLEMARTFNNGIGLVLIVDRERADEVQSALREKGPADVYRIGEVVGTPGVEMRNVSSWAE